MKIHIPYRRVLLKLSGESLLNPNQALGIGAESCRSVALGVKDLVDQGLQVAIVIGGGNLFRGSDGAALGIGKVSADHMGMLATIMNAITLQQMLEHISIHAEVMSSIACPPIAQSYHWKKAMSLLESNVVCIFAGGTGSPYFTTDTAAALRACECQAEILMKATKVDGIYSKDPKKHVDAVRFEKLRHSEVLAQKLDVMDATCVALCMSSQIPILVFDMRATPKFSEVLVNHALGTIVY
jgi:uridylate kinase